MLGQAAQATISYLKLPQGNSCFPDERSAVDDGSLISAPASQAGSYGKGRTVTAHVGISV